MYINKVTVRSLFSVLTELGICGRSFCELSGRTEPVIGDVIMALVEMGVSIEGIEAHAYRSQRSMLTPLSQSGQPKQLQILQAGQKQPHPSHIPNHLPPFPDPHAYIRTPVSILYVLSLEKRFKIKTWSV